MIYYANPTGSDAVALAMSDPARRIGCIDTPRQRNTLDPSWDLIADNGCFSGKWEAMKWWEWLSRTRRDVRFAVCPDVFEPGGDDLHKRTLALWDHWAPQMHDLGFSVAFVCQDGATASTIPTDADALFLGGTTEFKIGCDAQDIVSRWADSKWCHMGRVNSLRRMRLAHGFGCHSVDGTHLVFAPDQNLQNVERWLADVDTHPLLFSGVNPGIQKAVA